MRQITSLALKWAGLAIALVFGMFASVQPKAMAFDPNRIDNDLSNWSTVTLTVPVGERFQLNTQAQMRVNDNISQADRLLLLQDANIFLDKEKHWSAGVGGGWTPILNPTSRNEARTYEQVNYRHAVPGGNIWVRDRLEQRYIEDANGTANWNRTLVQYNHPLKNHPDWTVSGGNETLVQLYGVGKGPSGGLDQNRTYLTLGHDVNKHVKVEGGYMLLWHHDPNPGKADTLNHVILTQVLIH